MILPLQVSVYLDVGLLVRQIEYMGGGQTDSASGTWPRSEATNGLRPTSQPANGLMGVRSCL